jgi:predicted  nucleic acid-binding Zn-ribbon protein
VTDDDPLTPGEIRRSFTRLENEDRSLASRITSLAAEMLPVKLWDSEHRALRDRMQRHEKAAETDRARLEAEIKELREEIKDVREDQEKHSEITWQKVLGLVLALATIAGVIVSLMGQSKGIR